MFQMNQNEFDSIIDRFFDGAARVRAQKHEKGVNSKNLDRQFSSRLMTQMWDEERRNIKAA